MTKYKTFGQMEKQLKICQSRLIYIEVKILRRDLLILFAITIDEIRRPIQGEAKDVQADVKSKGFS